jgi:hypothetical protein
VPSTSANCDATPSAQKAVVTFTETTHGAAFQVATICSAADFSWSGVVYPGTYRVTVTGVSGLSNIPNAPFLAMDGVQVP